MLTADLVRARVHKGELKPRWIDASDRELLVLARELIAVFDAHVGHTRGELDEALAALLGEGTDYLLHRGLAKLLSDRAEFEVCSKVSPAELRVAVFDDAARDHPVVSVGDAVHSTTREMVLERVGARFEMTAEELSRCLYADLESEQVMSRGPEAITPEGLLERYNLALAQSVLFRASGLKVTLGRGDPARYQQVFRWMKFFRLMHRIEGSLGEGYTVHLDGPLSLFQHAQKYGLQLAEFLPALVKCDDWQAEAELLWGVEKRRVFFHLGPELGLVSHWRDTGVYISREEQWLLERFSALGSQWALERRGEIFDLGGRGVLVPDWVAVHPDGRVAYIEIIGFWKREYLSARAALLKRDGPQNLVLAVPARLKSDTGDGDGFDVETVFYKDVIIAKELLARVEKVALVVGTTPTVPEAKSPRKTRTVKGGSAKKPKTLEGKKRGGGAEG